MNVIFAPFNVGLLAISRSHFKQSKNCLFVSQIYVLRCFINFGVIWGDFLEEIDFHKEVVKFREI